MSRHDDPGWDADRDRELAELVSEAVSEVEPADRFDEIRARTAASPRRPWLLATGGTVLAAAAVVTAVALVGGDRFTADEPGPAGTPGQTTEPPTRPDPTSEEPSGDDGAGEVSTVAGYYLGETPAGVRLYREFRQLPGDPVAAALSALETPPLDPDYSSAWQPGQLLSADDGEDLVVVRVDPTVRERPAGMTESEARFAVQQVVYTVQAAVQARTPVQFVAEGEPVEQVFGVPTPEPVTHGAVLDTLARVNLTVPQEQATVSGGTLDVEGVASSFEANVLWRIEQDGETVSDGFITAEGWMGERLFPFSEEIDVSSLDPGTYALIVETDDPSGGAEGPGASSDSRTFVIE